MSTTTGRTPRVRPTLSIGRRLRKTVLVTHIVSAAAWIGIDVVVALLTVTSFLTDDAQTQAVAYRALGLVAVWPMLVAGLACLTSGLLLGLGTKYGLLRYWWVAIKLCLNVVLTTLVLVALRPGVDDLAEYGRATLAGESAAPVDTSQMAFPPAVSLTALTIAVVLSVFKPWGRTRKRASNR
ncbi:hypothetical protein [Solicola gregarius]|uniref:DUF2269 domain-containing protein n=1 Tax=Solicola gregarius TaxID=2908642 RepID=A0AA46YNL4_9ACTN|nr:hypothetical protein [Solicola gregarius]UYM07601.1 hypothetical protein L0C25_11165 [Solicola gregarius]